MMIGYGDDDGDYDDKDYFRMNIISTLLSHNKSWEWGRVKIPWMVFGWNYSLVNYLPWMLPDSAFTATPRCCWNIALLLKYCTVVETLHCLQSAIHFATSPCTVCTSEQNIFLMQQRLAMIPHPATSPHSAAAASQDPRTNPFNPTIRITLGPSDAFTPPPLMRRWMHHFCQLFASYKRAAVDTIDIGWGLKFHWNRNLWSFWKVFIGWSTVTK